MEKLAELSDLAMSSRQNADRITESVRALRRDGASWGDIGKVFKDLHFIPASAETKEYLTYKSAMAFIDRFYPGFDWSRRLTEHHL